MTFFGSWLKAHPFPLFSPFLQKNQSFTFILISAMPIDGHVSAKSVLGIVYTSNLSSANVSALMTRRCTSSRSFGLPRPFGLGDVPDRRASSPVFCIDAIIPYAGYISISPGRVESPNILNRRRHKCIQGTHEKIM